MRKNRAGRRLRIFGADQGVGMTAAGAKRFLAESRSVVKLGTIDASGEPNVHPVWYFFEPKTLLVYALVGSGTKKLRNIRRMHSIYFDVDDDRWPYKGVRGKGEAKELAATAKTMAITEKMLAKYIRKDHPMHKYFIDGVKKRKYVVVEIAPRYFSTWDYGKMPPDSLSAGLK